MVELRRRRLLSVDRPSDAVEVIEVCRGRLQREHLEWKAVVETLQTRMPCEALSKLAHSILLDRAIPVHELSPERHVAQSMLDRARRRKLRPGKQVTVCGHVLQPCGVEHTVGIWRCLFHVAEQKGRLHL